MHEQLKSFEETEARLCLMRVQHARLAVQRQEETGQTVQRQAKAQRATTVTVTGPPL